MIKISAFSAIAFFNKKLPEPPHKATFFIGLLITLFCSPILGEEKIDIWKNKEKKQTTDQEESISEKKDQQLNSNSIKTIDNNQNIKIEDSLNNKNIENKVFGIYDPAENDFNLNMWSSTKAEDINASLKRIKKIKDRFCSVAS